MGTASADKRREAVSVSGAVRVLCLKVLYCLTTISCSELFQLMVAVGKKESVDISFYEIYFGCLLKTRGSPIQVTTAVLLMTDLEICHTYMLQTKLFSKTRWWPHCKVGTNIFHHNLTSRICGKRVFLCSVFKATFDIHSNMQNDIFMHRYRHLTVFLTSASCWTVPAIVCLFL